MGNLTQDVVAKAVDVMRPTYVAWEQDKAVPQLRTRHRVDAYFATRFPEGYRKGELLELWAEQAKDNRSITVDDEAAVLSSPTEDVHAPDPTSDQSTLNVKTTPAFPHDPAPSPTTVEWGQGGETSRRPTSKKPLAVMVALIFAIGGLWAFVSSKDSPKQPYGFGTVVTIFNKVVLDENNMREDSPSYLSKRTVNMCKKLGCAVTNTGYGTGDKVRALCKTTGEANTNRFGDTPNKDNYDSTLWYLIVGPDGPVGYLSDVWINPTQRGGLKLPECDPDKDKTLIG